MDKSPDQHQPGVGVIGTETLQASGQLTILDPDAGEAVFDTHGLGFTYHGTHGDLNLRADGTWFYSADAGNARFFDGRPTTRGTAIDQLGEGQSLTDTITVYAKDGTAHDIVITIHGSNDRPYCSSEVALTPGTEDTAQTLTKAQLLANTVEVDANDVGKLSIAGLRADHGSIRDNGDGTYTFTPARDYNGSVHFTYDVKDAHGGVTHTGATTTLAAVSDAAIIGGTDTGSATEDHVKGRIVISGLLTVSDPDGPSQEHFQYSQFGEHAISDPFGGNLHIDSSGSWSYVTDNSNPAVQQLAAGQEGHATYRVRSADGTTHQIQITIHGTNDAPVLSASTASATEDGQSVTGQMSATDVDTGDTLAYSLGQAAPAGFTLKADGSWSFDPTNAAYQHLAAGATEQVTIPVTVTDGTDSDTQNLVITVTGTNDGPAVSGPVTLPGGTEDKAVQITAAQLLEHATDVDTGDQLSVTGLAASHGTITGDAATGFTFTPDANYNGPVALSYQVTDGHGGHVAQTASLTLSAVGDPAIITDVKIPSVTEDRGYINTHYELQVYGKLDITDPDPGEASFDPNIGSQTYQGIGYNSRLGGHVLLQRDGNFIYYIDNRLQAVQQLGAGQTATDTTTIRSLDGTTHQIQITIHGTNDAPVLSASTASATEDGSSVTGQMAATDVDHGDSQTYATGQPVDGFTMNQDGSWSFDPSHAAYQHLAAGQTQQITIPVTVTDSTGATDTENLVITVTGTGDAAVIGGVDTGSVTEASAGVDMSPDYAQPGMAKLSIAPTVSAYGQLTISDPDAGEAVFDSRLGSYDYHGSYGDLVLHADGRWAYYADAGHTAQLGGRATTRGTAIDQLGEGQSLTDTITVYAKDGTAHDIVITIHGSNDRPYCSSEVALTPGTEDTAQTLTKAQLLANTVEVDANDVGKLSIAGLRADHGSIRDNGDGTYTFTPARDYNGSVHFTYDVKDAHGGVTHTGATTTLAAVSDAAIIGGTDTGSATEDHVKGRIVISGLLTVSDPDGPSQEHFQYSQFGEHAISDPFGGNLHIDSSGSWSYVTDNSNPAVQQLAAGQEGHATYRVRSADGTTHQIQITIHGTNDAPVLSASTASATEDGQSVTGQMSATDVDTGDTLAYSLGQAAPAGFTLKADGSWSFDPTNAAYQHLAAGATEQVTIPVTVTDGTDSDTQNLVITVTGTNDGPAVSGPVTLPGGTEDKAVQITAAQLLEHATDVDTGDQLSVTGLAASHGTITGDAATGFTFTPDANYNGPVALSYQVTDGHGGHVAQKASLTLGATPDASIITGTDSGHVKEDSAPSTSGKLNISDPDGGAAAFVPVTNAQAPQHAGTYSIDAAGNWTFTLPSSRQSLHEGELIYDYFEVRGVDGTTHRVNITVEGTADVPKITGDTSGTVVEDTRTVARGTLNVHDPDWGQSGTDRTNYGQPRPSDGGFGAYEIDSHGHWTYRVDQTDGRVQALGEGETLTDSFTVTTLDGTKQPVQITITGTNDAPIVTPGDLGATQQGAGKTISTADLLAAVHATDVDRGDHLSISNVQVDPQYGSFHQSGGNWVFTPAAGASQTDVPVTISVTDGLATRSATATLDVTAAPTPPTATQVHGTGTTHLSGTLTGGSGGWAIDNGHGHGVLSLQGQYGTLTMDPQTGHFDYHYQPNSGVIKHGGVGPTSGRHTDTFHILQHGTHTSDADVQVNINVQSVHGHSGHHVDHTTLLGIDIVPITPSQHDAPSYDEPTFEVTVDMDHQDPNDGGLGLSEVSDAAAALRSEIVDAPQSQDNLHGEAPAEHPREEIAASSQGAPANPYLDAIGGGVDPDAFSQTAGVDHANPYASALGVDAVSPGDTPVLDPTTVDDPMVSGNAESDAQDENLEPDLPVDDPIVHLPEDDDPSTNSG